MIYYLGNFTTDIRLLTPIDGPISGAGGSILEESKVAVVLVGIWFQVIPVVKVVAESDFALLTASVHGSTTMTTNT